MKWINSMKYQVEVAGLIVVLAFLSFGTPRVVGQVIGQSVDNTWNLVEAVPLGDILEVRLKNGETKRGKIRSINGTELMLLHKGRDTTLQRNDISRIYQMFRQSTKPILIGAGAGFLIGVGTGAAIRGNNPTKALSVIPLVGGITAVAGAVIGWGISRRKSKVLIYESP